MVKDRLVNRLMLILVLCLVVIGVSACYKNAGENVQPTSNRVDLNDLAPTTPAPSPTTMATSVPTTQPQATATRTLVPTMTPPDAVPSEEPTVEPTEPDTAEPDTSESGEAAPPSNTPRLRPTFTPAIQAQTPTEPGIATPGMSDIQASNTPAPTIDPAFMPTPTAIPVEENPCIHVVRANDTLYSIAQNNEVLLADLVAANPTFLGGNPNTMLQIGWQLQIPGCDTGEPEATPVEEGAAEETTGDMVTLAPGGSTNYTVQAGDTIYSIGRKFGVDPQAIIDANALVNPNRISPGDVLIIPAAQ